MKKQTQKTTQPVQQDVEDKDLDIIIYWLKLIRRNGLMSGKNHWGNSIIVIFCLLPYQPIIIFALSINYLFTNN